MSEVSFSASVALLKPGITASPEEALNAWNAVKVVADTLPRYAHTIHVLAACSGGLIAIAIAAHALSLTVSLPRLVQGQWRSPIRVLSLAAKVALAAFTAFCLGLAALTTFGVFVRTNADVELKNLCKIVSLQSMDNTTLGIWKMLERVTAVFPTGSFRDFRTYSILSGICAVLALFGSVILDPETDSTPPLNRLKNRAVITSLALAAFVSIGTSDYIEFSSPFK